MNPKPPMVSRGCETKHLRIFLLVIMLIVPAIAIGQTTEYVCEGENLTLYASPPPLRTVVAWYTAVVDADPYYVKISGTDGQDSYTITNASTAQNDYYRPKYTYMGIEEWGETITVIVRTKSVTPSAATTEPADPVYCPSGAPNITLRYSGGTLGYQATAKWYTNSACTQYIGDDGGSGLVIAYPSSQTTYYVRFEGYCNKTSTRSVTVKPKVESSKPSEAYCNRDNICPNDGTIILSYSPDGFLGTGATAVWYTDAAFTLDVGTGNNLSLPAPGTTTTYYVRFEGDCNNTPAESVTLNVKIPAAAPSSASCNRDYICPGDGNIMLSFSGGDPGSPPAVASWYAGEGFTNLVGTGNDLTIAAPSLTTIYYVRYEGDCNTTSAVRRTVHVNSLSTKPSSALCNRDNICPGDGSITLSYTEGILGTGAIARWYSDALFENLKGNGNDLVIPAPDATTTYYVRFEGDCNTTAAENVTVNVKFNSLDPVNAFCDRNNLCPGDGNITLTYSGGSPGTGAVARWYDDAGFSNQVGTGNNLILPAPSSTTAYYVRFEGECNITNAVSTTVTIKLESTKPSDALCDRDNICPGDGNITLSYTGGTPGTGAIAKWYRDALFTDLAGTGNNLVLPVPASTQTYFVRFEGDCNSTGGESVTVHVKTNSIEPDAAESNWANVCPGVGNITLNYYGGFLGTGAIAKWYTDPGFLNLAGTGNGLVLPAPTSTQTYYVRFEGECNTTSAVTAHVNVYSISETPDAASCNRDNICPGDGDIILSYTGGTLGSGAVEKWYRNAAFTDLAGTGNNLTIPAPASTQTYYLRFEGTCNNTDAVSVTVNTKTESVAPAGAEIDRPVVCPGDGDITLSYSGGLAGTGAVARWYSDELFVTQIGTGNDLVISAPLTAQTYFVRYEGDCNETEAASVSIEMASQSINPSQIVASESSVCSKESVNLSISDGELGQGGSWKWYRDSCGGKYLGAGTSINVNPAITTTYYIRAEGQCDTTECISTTILIKDSVKIQTQPEDLWVCEGTEATFEVIAQGISPTYQWRKNEASIAGATDPVFTIAETGFEDEGVYECLITDECNSVNTDEVSLTVLPEPEILQNPASKNACSGDDISLSISSIHTDSVKYQWKIGEDDITGATDSVLQLTSVNSGDVGLYKCILTDQCGILSSQIAMVNVYPAPPAIELGADRSICEGSEIILQAGSGFASYLWSNEAITQNLSVSESGDYYVTGTDINGCISRSDTVNIDVRQPYDKEKICVVTVDLATGQNLVVWEKTANEAISSYNIYREDELIGNVAFDDLSIFKDIVADPETRPYLYSISIIDTCGNESQESPYHKPLFLQYVSSSGGVILGWSKYEIENGEITFDDYSIYRGSDSLSLAPFAENIPTVVDVYTDKDPMALLRKYYYRVAGTLVTPCYPTAGGKKAAMETYQQSLSNLDDNKVVTGKYDPDTILIDVNSIDEENLVGDTIGKLTTVDKDSNETHVYTFVSGSGDDDNSSFTITGDMLMAAEVFDYETKSQYSIRLRSTDPIGKYVEIVFIILVNDVEETTGLPVIKRNAILAYPNPFSHSTTILFSNPGNEAYTLFLTNLSGKVTRIVEDITGSKYILERAELGKGLYFVELRGSRIYRGKIIIE